MPNKRLYFLFELYLSKQADDLEKAELLELLTEPKNEAEARDLLGEAWVDFESPEPLFTPLESNKILNNIFAATQNADDIEEKISPTKKLSWPLALKIAAVLLVVCSVGLLIFKKPTQLKDQIQKSIVANKKAKVPVIAPGGNKATLTLTDGSVIALDDLSNGEIANKSGISVSKAADGQLVYKIDNSETALVNRKNGIIEYNTISTPRGGQYQINLPDGSKVWLNSESSLKFPTVLLDEALRVELKGEAYFEIKKRMKNNARLAFIVASTSEDGRKQEVEVLGTHFNVKSYGNEAATKTTLLEGSVRVTNLNSNKVSLLTPGQQSIMNVNSTKIAHVDLEEVMAWKKGKFIFNNMALLDIIKQLERWYDVDANYNHVPNSYYYVSISKNVTLAQVLEMLELTGDLKFNITKSTSGTKGKIELLKK
jgi:transmembrane sensor